MQEEFDRIELEPNSNGSRRIAIAVISILCVILAAVTAALLVRHYVITTYIVDGISMYPTLDGGNGEYSDNERENGETLYLNMVSKIKRGDIVVFHPVGWNLLDYDDNSVALVKRVIAVGGDHLEIKDNVVYLNGEALDETYINGPMDTPDLEVDIPDGYIFCMGDNRNHSLDCRKNGPVSLDTVIGKCFMIKSINGKLRFL
ncbi:MAG: signal peptidase I [Clostridia bacterium]|nr:signal peptidase I [Clostridia bacterium]